MSEFRLPTNGLGRLAQAGAAEDRYRLGDELARGGMGVVFRARDELLGREVAVKVLLAPPSQRPDLVRRFVQEARITGRLQHPGIPPVYELGWLTDGRPFLALKLIEGRTLAEFLGGTRDLSADREWLLAVFERVCQTVEFAHAQGIVHRDLKPSNVMVGAFGEVQVVDWGLARGLDDGADGGAGEPAGWDRSPPHVTDPGQVLGTPAYMAPERVCGARGDERSDVFGLGAILCEVLTGQPPYAAGERGAMTRLLVGNPSGGLDGLRRCGADPGLIGLACECLASDPAERPADAAALARALGMHREWVVGRLRQAERDEAAAEARDAERALRRRLTGGVLALAAVLVAVLVGFAWRHQNSEARRAAEWRQQAEAAHRVGREALAQAAEPLRQGHWGRAVAILELAAAQLDPQPGAGGEIGRLLADARLARDLEGLRLHGPLSVTRETAVRLDPRGCEETFLRHGWDLRGDPVGAADRVRRSSCRLEVLNGLHAWMFAEPPGVARQRLAAVLGRTDDDPWRRRVRGLAKAAPLDELLRLAADLPPRPQPPLIVIELARRLDRAGSDRGLALRREAQRRFPSEFWYSHDLASVLAGRPGRLDEAVGFGRVTVALRPDEPTAWNNLGVLLMRSGDQVAALQALKRATDLGPGVAAIRVNYGHALVRAGRAEQAAREAAQAVRAAPRLPEAYMLLGVLAARREDEAAAWAAYRRALEIDPTFAPARDELALAPKDVAAGRAEVEAALKQGPTAGLYFVKGHLLLKSADAAGAADAFRRAAELAPDDPRVLLGWAKALAARGDEAASLDRGSEALLIDPGLLAEFLRLGPFDDPARARPGLERLADRLVSRYPERAEGWALRGLTLVHRRDGPAADDACRRALALAPRLAPAHLARGLALELIGDRDAALTAYFLASAYDPKDPRPLQALGTARLLRREAGLADSCFRHLERRGLDPSGAAIGRSQALMLEGNGEAAGRLLDERLKARPADARLLNARGAVAEGARRPADARALYERALRADPRLTAARMNLAHILFGLGKTKDGLAEMRTACELDPAHAHAHLNLGRALSRHVGAREAEPALRKALQLDDTRLDTRLALATVLMQLDRDGEAESVLRPAASRDAADGAVRVLHGQALLRSHRYAEAAAQLELAEGVVPAAHPSRAELRGHLAQARRMVKLDAKLDAVLAGTARLDPSEALDLADVCARGRGRPAEAAALLVTFFATDPMAATDPRRGWHARAARVALLAAESPAVAARWRRQALTWLERERRTWERLKAEGALRGGEASAALAAWLTHPSLADVREGHALDRLPPDEAAAWRGLWQRTAAAAGPR